MNKIFILVSFLSIASCAPNMEADANRACELMSETKELMPQIMKLSMQSAFGTDAEMSEASNELSALEKKFEQIGSELEQLSANYDEDELQNYLLDNCEIAKDLKDMGEAMSTVELKKNIQNAIEENVESSIENDFRLEYTEEVLRVLAKSLSESTGKSYEECIQILRNEMELN